ncbi:helix-turn-helix domain-containing protein [Streptomyces sp. NPDC002132]|uniref:helix-turn-helix domain-containing protein n=1 Tax=unclassified Streptomyces TaxID=2593676 RepID=UPI003324D382
MTYSREERERVRTALEGCRAASVAQGRPGGDSALANALGYKAETVRKYMLGERMPPPRFVRALAELAGVSPARVFADIGWLPRGEAPSPAAYEPPPELVAALSAISGIEAYVRGFTQARLPAPLRAAAALCGDRRAAARFRVGLSHLVSGREYPVSTALVSEFRLTAGAEALPWRELAERALRAGPSAARLPDGTAVDDGDGEHARVRAELGIVVSESLRAAGEFSWQGEPGTSLWAPAAAEWPGHLLVQNCLVDLHRQAAYPWRGVDQRPLVVVGAVWSAALTAALVADALGWEYVPVSSATEVDGGRVVQGDPLDRRSGRLRGWAVTARHIAERVRLQENWPAVVLVKPYVFAEEGHYGHVMADLLRETGARVLYVRPSHRHLDWWAARRDLTSVRGTPGDVWRAGIDRALERVEDVLHARRGGRGLPVGGDLLLTLPDPPRALPAADPRLPAHLVDHQFRCAWRVLEWLDESANRGRPSLFGELRPSNLADHANRLRADRAVRALRSW